ncbi:MAG: hypothetical protein ACRBK7_26530 [Acidimicrobiales bacterium]
MADGSGEVSHLAEPSPAEPAQASTIALPLALATAICLVAYGALVVADRSTGTLRGATTPTTLGFIGLAFVGYLAAARQAERSPTIPWQLLWLAPIVFRLLLLATEPTLSDDVYRYLWDGHVLSNGVNPFSHAISSSELDGLAIPIRELANNPDLSSPYLPTLQLLFAALSVIAPSNPLVMQVAMVGFDIAAALVIRKLLIAADLPPNRVLLYLWNPLVIVESAHGAHFDSLLTFLLLAAILSAVRPARNITSPLALGLATLTRPIPGLLAPVLWWNWNWVQRATFFLTLVVLLVPFGFGVSGWGLFGERTGAGVFGSARVYSAEFRFNAVVAQWLEGLTQSVGVYSAISSGLVVVTLFAVWFVARPTGGVNKASGVDADDKPAPAEVRRIIRLATVPLAAYLVLTPVFHPWYLVSIIAVGLFLAPTPQEGRSRWLLVAPIAYLSATAPLSYLTYRDPNAFRELDWVRRVEWYPALTLAVIAVVVAVRIVARPARAAQSEDLNS